MKLIFVGLFTILFAQMSFADQGSCSQSFEKIVVKWYASAWSDKGTEALRQQAISGIKHDCESWGGRVKENSIINLSSITSANQVGGICMLSGRN